jgi:hypothetical protein
MMTFVTFFIFYFFWRWSEIRDVKITLILRLLNLIHTIFHFKDNPIGMSLNEVVILCLWKDWTLFCITVFPDSKVGPLILVTHKPSILEELATFVKYTSSRP